MLLHSSKVNLYMQSSLLEILFFISSAPSWTWGSFPRRYLIAILAFFGFFNIYSLRVNLSIAIVAMTENRTITHSNGTIEYVSINSSPSAMMCNEQTGLFLFLKIQEFPWSSKEQGLLLSSFFYGYIITQLPGGWLAPRMGAAKLYGFGILATALLTLLTPVIAYSGIVPLVAVRILEGIFEVRLIPKYGQRTLNFNIYLAI